MLSCQNQNIIKRKILYKEIYAIKIDIVNKKFAKTYVPGSPAA